MTLVDAFPPHGSVRYLALTALRRVVLSDISISSSGSHAHGKASSHGHGRGSSSGPFTCAPEARESKCGDRPVLLLLGIRLGLDGVNPIYYETIKLLYTFPQSVGIAGGRPSSSYYFVGVQGDGLFYLDPHHSRPSVPLRPFMDDQASIPRPPTSLSHGYTATSSLHGQAREHRSLSPEAAAYARGGSSRPEGYVRAGSMSPDFVYARGGSMSPDFGPGNNLPMTEDELFVLPRRASSTTDYDAARAPPARIRRRSCARSTARGEEEWVDLRRRIKEAGLLFSFLPACLLLLRALPSRPAFLFFPDPLPRTIFSIQDEPPTWPGADDDDDMGLESVSDPEEEELVDDGDISSASHAPSSSVSHNVIAARALGVVGGWEEEEGRRRREVGAFLFSSFFPSPRLPFLLSSDILHPHDFPFPMHASFPIRYDTSFIFLLLRFTIVHPPRCLRPLAYPSSSSPTATHPFFLLPSSVHTPIRHYTARGGLAFPPSLASSLVALHAALVIHTLYFTAAVSPLSSSPLTLSPSFTALSYHRIPPFPLYLFLPAMVSVLASLHTRYTPFHLCISSRTYLIVLSPSLSMSSPPARSPSLLLLPFPLFIPPPAAPSFSFITNRPCSQT
ncbi:hypothetical protein DFH06DRAFT_1319245 [Mycena polygramma]|nr:hypothetical protein DFH06DRAFT_1319245 [Mycena polygramma]